MRHQFFNIRNALIRNIWLKEQTVCNACMHAHARVHIQFQLL